MGRDWTEEQRQVVKHSEGDLLVAAAAGSGKTAVLVERIVTMLMDDIHPIDIDRMLVVTFTRAAAAEMKERIGNRIAELLMENPENESLQRQQRLLHNAAITTIDSFCLQVVKEFFHRIDLTPGFRIGEEAEMKLLQSDVLKEVLEENYATADEAFFRFVECYAPGKTDSALEDYILKLFLFSESYEWPEEWLQTQADNFMYEDEAAFQKSSLVQAVMEEAARQLTLAQADINQALQLVNTYNLTGYQSAVQQDYALIQNLAAAKDYVSFSKLIRAHEFGRMNACAKSVDQAAKEEAKALRDSCKDTITTLLKQYFFQEAEAMYQDMKTCAPHMRELVRLTLAFRKKYSETKKDKNLLDFSDLGHYALQILLTEQDGDWIPSETAEILRGRYDRIMVDEYQDSNRIQETLLWAISRLHERSAEYPEGRPNIFTVGDVKQSIYRFRQARPELFMEKYEKYGAGDPAYQKIVLKKNFRSRPSVLDAVNTVFEWCMHKEFGGIEYDKDAALHVGLPYEACTGQQGPYDPELILVAGKPDDVEEAEAEAEVCADRILRLVSDAEGLQITENGQKRKAEFKDIAILLRSAKGWAETFVNVLKDRGIPARATVATGFFETGEVVTVLNYLRILDNPQQDIPLAQVLLSPVFGFSNDELARIKGDSGRLYDMLNRYEKQADDEGLSEKVIRFLELYRYFRQRKRYLAVSELIQEIYRETGLYNIIAALPAGEQRVANLEYLLRQAQNYAATSYHGLFQFIRYVEKLNDNEVDFGEAATADAGNAVKIMTIHKSKGLEFPVVLIPACGKQFNQMDAKTRVVLHADYGIGPECIDSEERTRMTTLKKQYIRQMLRQETIAEELRMLYVAMTRAREKLILVAGIKEADKFLLSCAASSYRMDYRQLLSAVSYLDFVKGAVLRRFAGTEWNHLQPDNAALMQSSVTGQSVVWHFIPVNAGAASVTVVADVLEERKKKEQLLKLIRERDVKDVSGALQRSAEYQRLKENLYYCYPYENAITQALKTSVSELKRRHLQEEQEQEAEVPVWLKRKMKRAAQQTSGLSAAERGTLYHKILEMVPLATVRTEEELKEFCEELVNRGRVTQEEMACIEPDRLIQFLKSELAERMRKAELQGRLKREQPFVLGIETTDGSGDYELVQGIIDLYFEEENGVVLVDYKTDRVETTEELAERYRIQLQYYARAIRQITGKEVKEILIYSLHLSETILLE